MLDYLEVRPEGQAKMVWTYLEEGLSLCWMLRTVVQAGGPEEDLRG